MARDRIIQNPEKMREEEENRYKHKEIENPFDLFFSFSSTNFTVNVLKV